MPISADPDRAVWYPLELQPDKQFLCRFMTVREHLKIDDLITEANQISDEKAAIAKLVEIVAVGVIDWKGIDGEFSPEKLVDVLTPSELIELATGYRYAVRAKESDLKKSKRESLSPAVVPDAAGSQTPAK